MKHVYEFMELRLFGVPGCISEYLEIFIIMNDEEASHQQQAQPEQKKVQTKNDWHPSSLEGVPPEQRYMMQMPSDYAQKYYPGPNYTLPPKEDQ